MRRWGILVSVVMLAMAILAGCNRSGVDAARGGLIAGKAPHAVSGVDNAAALTDGVATLPGDDWETHLSARFADEEAFVTYDLGAVVQVRALWFQADHNDDYRFSLSEDGEVFEQIWYSSGIKPSGMQDRSTQTLDVMGRYLRVGPVEGDGRFGVSELGVFTEAPEALAAGVSRKRGVSLEVMVRTQVLLFAAAAIVFLILAFRGAPALWIATCAALPVLAGILAIDAVCAAWPVEPRQVSMVRSASAAIAGVAILREVFAPRRFRAHPVAIFSCLGVSGLLAMLAFYNLGRPQFWDAQSKSPTPIHLLDLRQYYGTAKYFDELGYRGMYLADVAAYVEDIPGATLDNLRDTPMRDLSTHKMSTIGAHREEIENIKQQFSAERWQRFKDDARYFRDVMGKRDYLKYMIDFGGNATPVWIGIAHVLFNTFDASNTTFVLTGLLDPLLFLVTFAAIGRCFGYRTMWVVMVVFGANDFVMYGTNWGGATLRHDWLMYIALGACAFKRERWALGGFFLALSTLIRAFPVVTLLTASFPALWWLFEFHGRERRWPSFVELREAQRPLLRIASAAALTALVLIAATSLRWSLPAWMDWLAKVSKLNADSHGNSVALRNLVAGWEPGHHQLLVARWPLYAAALAFYVGITFLMARHKPLDRAAILGILLVPVLFYAANYYIHVVCLLPLLAVERRTRAAGAEEAPSPLSTSDAWVWIILLGLCVAQYWTVLVTDLPLHFYLATVLLFAAMTALMLILVRADVREGRLPFVSRWLGLGPAVRSPERPAPRPVGS